MKPEDFKVGQLVTKTPDVGWGWNQEGYPVVKIEGNLVFLDSGVADHYKPGENYLARYFMDNGEFTLVKDVE